MKTLKEALIELSKRILIDEKVNDPIDYYNNMSESNRRIFFNEDEESDWTQGGENGLVQ